MIYYDIKLDHLLLSGMILVGPGLLLFKQVTMFLL